MRSIIHFNNNFKGFCMDNNFSPIKFNKGERLSVYIQPNSNSVIVSGYDKK